MENSGINFRCAACGSDQFIQPDGDPKPDDAITCAGCGAVGKYGDIQSAAVEQAKNLLADTFRGIFGKR